MNAQIKTCGKCGVAMQPGDYYAKTKLCKPCHKVRDASRHGRATVTNDSEAARARKRRWKSKQLPGIRDSARQAVHRAIACGRLFRRLDCEACGAFAVRADGVTAVHAHHDDYSKPLEVRWLCAKCHTHWHKHNAARQPDKDANNG